MHWQVPVCRHGLYTLLQVVRYCPDRQRSAVAVSILDNLASHKDNASMIYRAELRLKHQALMRRAGLQHVAVERISTKSTRPGASAPDSPRSGGQTARGAQPSKRPVSPFKLPLHGAAASASNTSLLASTAATSSPDAALATGRLKSGRRVSRDTEKAEKLIGRVSVMHTARLRRFRSDTAFDSPQEQQPLTSSAAASTAETAETAEQAAKPTSAATDHEHEAETALTMLLETARSGIRQSLADDKAATVTGDSTGVDGANTARTRKSSMLTPRMGDGTPRNKGANIADIKAAFLEWMLDPDFGADSLSSPRAGDADMRKCMAPLEVWPCLGITLLNLWDVLL